MPLRVPRPGPSVGKVAQCLSHDPWGEAFFLLGPWMEMGHQRKSSKGWTNISAHPKMHATAGTQRVTASHYLFLHWHYCLIASSILTVRIIYKFPILMHLQWQQHIHTSSYSIPLLTVTSVSFSHNRSYVETKENLNVCVYFKIVVLENVGQKLQLVKPLMVSLNMVFRGQSILKNMQLMQQCSTFFNHRINPVNVTLIKVT